MPVTVRTYQRRPSHPEDRNEAQLDKKNNASSTDEEEVKPPTREQLKAERKKLRKEKQELEELDKKLGLDVIRKRLLRNIDEKLKAIDKQLNEQSGKQQPEDKLRQDAPPSLQGTTWAWDQDSSARVTSLSDGTIEVSGPPYPGTRKGTWSQTGSTVRFQHSSNGGKSLRFDGTIQNDEANLNLQLLDASGVPEQFRDTRTKQVMTSKKVRNVRVK